MTRRAAIPNHDQGPYVAIPANASPVALTTAEEVHADQLQAGGSENG